MIDILLQPIVVVFSIILFLVLVVILLKYGDRQTFKRAENANRCHHSYMYIVFFIPLVAYHWFWK